MDTGRKMLAEAIGTFFLCFAGIAAIVNAQNDLLGIALAHGIALAIGVSIFAGISGGHLNPAVTIGFLSTGRIKPPLALLYIVAQLAGATLAALACKWMFPPEAVASAQLGIPLPGAWVTLPVLLGTEAILTFLLMTSIFGTAVDERAVRMKLGGFAIGLTVTFDILAGGPVTGASMNPARSFGPALVQGNFHLHWCYWVAPIVGAVIAAQMFHLFLLKEDSKR
jgi:MIP family channel proteins